MELPVRILFALHSIIKAKQWVYDLYYNWPLEDNHNVFTSLLSTLQVIVFIIKITAIWVKHVVLQDVGQPFRTIRMTWPLRNHINTIKKRTQHATFRDTVKAERSTTCSDPSTQKHPEQYGSLFSWADPLVRLTVRKHALRYISLMSSNKASCRLPHLA